MMSHVKQFEHLRIQLETIKLATNNFADENCIGKGGFGKVYKGEIFHSKGPSRGAFKRLDRKFGQGDLEFWKEIMMLSIYRHENIVSLLGFCDESDEKILVYEYASKRSLDLNLKNDDLTWIQRLKICIGVARGLAYLHNPFGTQNRLLHRDIKSSNILLDENWNPKISDFGLSKFGVANHQFTFVFSNPVGTIGYCDPQYGETGLLTKECDVYSFGVVLFEVLCGRLCFTYNNNDGRLFTKLVRECYEKNKMNEIIHDSIMDEIGPHSLKEFTKIAYRCLEKDREERPLMTEIVRILNTALEYQTNTESWKLCDTVDSSLPEVSLLEHLIFFNMKYFEDQVLAAEWDEVERYLCRFTKLEDNRYSLKIFFEIRKQKYLEALDRRNRARAVEILVKDLKFLSTYNEELYKDMTLLITLDDFRKNEQLSMYGDTKSQRSIMLVELKKLIVANPMFRERIQVPTVQKRCLSDDQVGPVPPIEGSSDVQVGTIPLIKTNTESWKLCGRVDSSLPEVSLLEHSNFFNMKYFGDQVLAGEWDEVERYLCRFTKLEDNRYSLKIFFEIRKQKYYEALDRNDRAKAVEILMKDLKIFATYNEKIYKELTLLTTLDDIRENEQLSKYGDTKSQRSDLVTELRTIIVANPMFTERIHFPKVRASQVPTRGSSDVQVGPILPIECSSDVQVDPVPPIDETSQLTAEKGVHTTGVDAIDMEEFHVEPIQTGEQVSPSETPSKRIKIKEHTNCNTS